MIARERICLTGDGKHAVPATHAGAACLLAGVGCEIEEADARRLGLVDGRLPADWEARLTAPPAKAASEEELLAAAVPQGEVLGAKSQAPAENKAMEPAENKGGLSLPRERRRR